MVAHARLDQTSMSGLFDDRPSYAAYLHATWCVRHHIEAVLDACAAECVFPLWPRRKLASALGEDIRDLAGEYPKARPDPQELLMAYAPSQMLGVLYVLEGSALGANVLKQRALALGLGPAFGARHLAQQTAIPDAWPSFLSRLEAAPLDARQDTQCIDAAIATFARFEHSYLAAAIKTSSQEQGMMAAAGA